MARERNAEARVNAPEEAPENVEFRDERPVETVGVPPAEEDKSVVRNRAAEVREEVENDEASQEVVAGSNEKLFAAAAERGVDLGAVSERLARNPNSIYNLDKPEAELVDPASEENVAEGKRLASDARRRVEDAFPPFDNVDPQIRARDAVQVMQENAHYEGLARVLRGAIRDDAGVPAHDENNLPPEVLQRRALEAQAGLRRDVGGRKS